MKYNYDWEMSVCAAKYIRENGILDTPQNQQLVKNIMLVASLETISSIHKEMYDVET